MIGGGRDGPCIDDSGYFIRPVLLGSRPLQLTPSPPAQHASIATNGASVLETARDLNDLSGARQGNPGIGRIAIH
jgi:hypothetical protein